MYSPVTGQWSQVANMNEQRYGVGVGVMDGECDALCTLTVSISGGGQWVECLGSAGVRGA